jgi:hypothetical protein
MENNYGFSLIGAKFSIYTVFVDGSTQFCLFKKKISTKLTIMGYSVFFLFVVFPVKLQKDPPLLNLPFPA